MLFIKQCRSPGDRLQAGIIDLAIDPSGDIIEGSCDRRMEPEARVLVFSSSIQSSGLSPSKFAVTVRSSCFSFCSASSASRRSNASRLSVSVPVFQIVILLLSSPQCDRLHPNPNQPLSQSGVGMGIINEVGAVRFWSPLLSGTDPAPPTPEPAGTPPNRRSTDLSIWS